METLDFGGPRRSDRRESRVLGGPSRRAANYTPGTAVSETRVSSEGSQVLMGPCQGVGRRQGPQVGAEWRCANFYAHARFGKIGVVYEIRRLAACERRFCVRTRNKLVFFSRRRNNSDVETFYDIITYKLEQQIKRLPQINNVIGTSPKMWTNKKKHMRGSPMESRVFTTAVHQVYTAISSRTRAASADQWAT